MTVEPGPVNAFWGMRIGPGKGTTPPEGDIAMKRVVLGALFLVLAINFVLSAQSDRAGAKIYLAPQGGFETYLAAAFTSKHLHVTIVSEPDQADYVLEAVPVEHKHRQQSGAVFVCVLCVWTMSSSGGC